MTENRGGLNGSSLELQSVTSRGATCIGGKAQLFLLYFSALDAETEVFMDDIKRSGLVGCEEDLRRVQRHMDRLCEWVGMQCGECKFLFKERETIKLGPTEGSVVLTHESQKVSMLNAST